MTRFRGLLMVVLIGFAVVTVAAPGSAEAAPVLTVTPTQGPAGSLVTGRLVTDDPLHPFRVLFRTAGQADVQVATSSTNMLGVAVFTFTVPAGATEGAHTVFVQDVLGSCDASAPFTVGPALVTPTATPPPPTPTASPLAPTPTRTPAPPVAGSGTAGGGELPVGPAVGALVLFGLGFLLLGLSRKGRPALVPEQVPTQPVALIQPFPREPGQRAPHATGLRGRNLGSVLIIGTALIAGTIAFMVSRRR